MEQAYSPPQQLLPLRTTMTAFKQTFPALMSSVYASEHGTKTGATPFIPGNRFNTSRLHALADFQKRFFNEGTGKRRDRNRSCQSGWFKGTEGCGCQ
jgi:hypothetical protein